MGAGLGLGNTENIFMTGMKGEQLHKICTCMLNLVCQEMREGSVETSCAVPLCFIESL